MSRQDRRELDNDRQIKELKRRLSNLENRQNRGADSAFGSGSIPVVENLAVSTGVGSIKISWNPVLIRNLRFYEVKISDNVDFNPSETINTPETFYDYTGGTGGTTYYIKVRAISADGDEGSFSITESSAPGTAATADIRVQAVTDTTVFTDNSNSVFLEEDYGILEPVMTANFYGNGFLTEFSFSNISFHDMHLDGDGILRFGNRYSIVNESNGGSEITSGLRTFQEFYSVDLEGGADGVWTNVGNAKVADGFYAICRGTGGIGVQTLVLEHFGFYHVIPSTATLLDVQVVIKGQAAGGTGTPSFTTELNFDGPTHEKTSLFTRSGSFTAVNTQYTFGYESPESNGAATSANEHWLGSWGGLTDGSNPLNVFVTTALTMDDIRRENFGMVIHVNQSFTGTVMLDYVGMRVRYSTEDYLDEAFQIMGSNYGNNNYTEPGSTIGSYRHVAQLNDGDSYRFKVEQIRAEDSDPDAGIEAISSNKVLTVREFKR